MAYWCSYVVVKVCSWCCTPAELLPHGTIECQCCDGRNTRSSIVRVVIKSAGVFTGCHVCLLLSKGSSFGVRCTPVVCACMYMLRVSDNICSCVLAFYYL